MSDGKMEQITKEEQIKAEKKMLNIWESVITLLSSNIGAGFVAIPYAFYNLGPDLAFVTMVVTTIVNFQSITLWLESQRVLKSIGKDVNSIYEISFALYGRSSIYWSTTIIFIDCFFLCVCFYMLCGEMAQEIITNIFFINNAFLSSPILWKIVLNIVLLKTTIAMEMADIKLIAKVLFLCVFIFLFLLFVKVVSSHYAIDNIVNETDVPPSSFTKASTSLASILCAFCIQMSVYPTQASMRDRSFKNSMSVNNWSNWLSCVCYSAVGYFGSLLYAQKIRVSVLANVGEKKTWIDDTAIVLFFIALSLHVPFIFYPAKEAFLSLFDELTRESMTKQLKNKLNQDPNGPVVKTKMAYKSMPYKRYLMLTLGLNILMLILCILIDNLGMMLDIISVFCCTAMIFLMPAFFYLHAVEQALNPKDGSEGLSED